MAEALGKYLYPRHVWRSRGLAVRTGSRAAEHVAVTLGAAGSQVTNHAATAVKAADVEWADEVYVMTARQVQELQHRLGTPASRLDEREDISDPYGSDIGTYRRSRDHITRAMLKRFGTP